MRPDNCLKGQTAILTRTVGECWEVFDLDGKAYLRNL